MERTSYHALLEWKNSSRRKPSFNKHLKRISRILHLKLIYGLSFCI